MGRSYGRHAKKNKLAKTMKRVSQNKLRVESTNNENSTPNIFDDIFIDDDRIDTEDNRNNQSSTTNIFNDIIIDDKIDSEDKNCRNPKRILKQYPPQSIKRRNKIESFGKSGMISSDECDDIMNHPLNIEFVPKENSPISGNRIVDLSYVLSWSITLQYEHAKICTLGKLYVDRELRKNQGLVSTIIFKCTMCCKIYEYQTEAPNGEEKSSINYGAVWGTLATGSTFGHMEEFLSCLNIPSMPDNMFYEIENDIGKEWRHSLWRSMEAAGVKERENAIEKGHLCDDGIPWITVYVDGSWSKRSYGSNFSSLSGMFAIVGRHTGELLFIAVRNKFCAICARAENKNEESRDHVCYKNWSSSSTSMESDMAVEGFSCSENMHQIRYLQFIADGDSSVFSKIKEKVPYGENVRKIECTNHAIKNYGKNLRKIKADTHINVKGRKLLSIEKINLLTKRAKSTIYGHSEEKNVELFREDLRNNLHHVFGDHVGCREEICKDINNQSENKIPELKANGIYEHIRGALTLLLRKAHLLIENENNNRSEQLMNIVARFNMGKRLNLVQRGSYERRVHLSGLRYNKSFDWHASPWKRCVGKSPGAHFKNYIRKQNLKKNAPCRKQLFVKEKQKLSKRVMVNKKNTDYGIYADEPEEEIDTQFIMMEAKLISQQMNVTKEEIQRIQQQSVGQFGNQYYESYRKKRLTASLFGRVVKRRSNTPCHNIVKSCLQPAIFQTEATEYGILKESVAIILFEKAKSVKVEKSGLWIDETFGFLGASPDGLIGEDSIVEVKCIYAPDTKFVTLEELIISLKSKSFLKITDNGIKLNRRHSYYYQIQGQLNITKRQKCFLVVYVNDNIPIFIEEILKDIDFWEDKMLPILTQFYNECIAPEIARENLKKNKKCIDPPYIVEAIKLAEEKKSRKRKRQ